MSVRCFGLSDVGLVRECNEDSYWFDPKRSLAVVCDGLGGHSAGDVASLMVVELFQTCDILKPDRLKAYSRDQLAQALQDVIEQANTLVFEKAQSDPQKAGMASTVIALALDGDNVVVACVGDSRAYFLGDKGAEQLSVDHTWVQEQVDLKRLTEEQARNHNQSHVVTRAVGASAKVEVDIRFFPLKAGCYLLCSDGLTGLLKDRAIWQIVQENKDDLKQACQSLVRAANEQGGTDNITVVLMQVQG